MTASAILTMVIGIAVIWGGLVLSILHAVKKSKQQA